ERRPDVVAELAGRRRGHQVPLVDDEDGRLALFEDVLSQLLVHLADADARVEEEQHRVGPADGTLGAVHAVKLNVGAGALRAADAGRVDGDEDLAVSLEADIDAVARGPRHLANDDALGLGQAVDERALARVAPADDGQLHGHVEVRLGLILLRQALEDEVEQLLLAAVLVGADANQLGPADLVELGGLWLQGRGVAFVGDQDDRFSHVAQPAGNLLVERHQAGADVNHEEDNGSLVEGGLDLAFDLDGEVIAVLNAHAAG